MLSLAVLLPTEWAMGQGLSQSSLRFFGTGTDQQDRVRIQIDDDASGPDASTPLDLGAGSFSIDFWVRGRLADNPRPLSGGVGPGGEFFDFRWIDGHVLIDRDIWGPSSRDWGVSVARGRVRFGTGYSTIDSEHTIESAQNILDDTWRHVAVIRDAATGVKSIYVDGLLDYASPPNRSRDDLSYPDAGVVGAETPWGPFIVIGAEKHDAGSEYPSFSGWMDEVRFWNVALNADQVADVRCRVLPAATPGLIAAFRFEEGAGSVVAGLAGAAAPGGDASIPTGQLIAGMPGNGEWSLRSVDPLFAAPVPCDGGAPGPCPGDLNDDGVVDLADLLGFLGAWNPNLGQSVTPGTSGDVNGDGVVDLADLLDFLGDWNPNLGQSCP
ncbi:MAG: hypothetical protein KF768_06455 [Phycisphaeraceae bacterium]|nr:hypothetical protein [Phycisphaeraceae bacterium]